MWAWLALAEVNRRKQFRTTTNRNAEARLAPDLVKRSFG